MSSRTLTTATGVFLALEPTLSEFDQWNRAALAKRQLVDDWIKAALDSASHEKATTFADEEFSEPDPWQARDRFSIDLKEFASDSLTRQLLAALKAKYPPALCRRVAGRTKPTRYSATLFLAPWAHATLNRAANAKGATLPANVILFPTQRGATK